MINDQQYIERYIAFIDILGFRDAIKKSQVDETLREQILNGLKSINKIKNYVDSTNENQDNNRYKEIEILWFQPKIQIFSDSIYISIFKTPENLSKLGAYCTLIYATLFSFGLFARGAITKGNSFESEDTIFGQGLIDAYDLESKVALYPRILISDSILSEVQETGTFHLEKDFDGSHYIDVFYGGILKIISNWETQSGIKMDLAAGKERLITEYKSSDNQSIRAKLYWLIQYFNGKTDHHKLAPIEVI